ncbi:MAG: amidohydrolase [Deltaproteobacteria bacterium]|nr:MAG: amidohydrolase [Deltaproteobacteria bacterium]
MQDLKVALIQAELAWENPDANLERFGKRIDHLRGAVDLIVLPEMFTTGFSMHPQRLAQPMDGKVVAWMHKQSKRAGADLVGSLTITENGCYYNRLVWVQPDGALHWYDKKHLFRYADEHLVYTAGRDRLSVICRGWRIRPFICYDLRFPIWTRNLNNVYDATLFVANWPQRRSSHWKALLTARAIENQCYVAGVNRVGIDGNDHRYSGDTRVVSPAGEILVGASHVETSLICRFSASELESCRRVFPAWKDADGDMLKA